MELSILFFKGMPVKIFFLCMKIVFILANSANQGEMPHKATFHLGLHSLPKYLFTQVSQNEKGQMLNCISKLHTIYVPIFGFIYFSLRHNPIDKILSMLNNFIYV